MSKRIAAPAALAVWQQPRLDQAYARLCAWAKDAKRILEKDPVIIPMDADDSAFLERLRLTLGDMESVGYMGARSAVLAVADELARKLAMYVDCRQPLPQSLLALYQPLTQFIELAYGRYSAKQRIA